MRVDIRPDHVVVRQRTEEHVVPGKRLGRHQHFDSRSLAYPVLAPLAAPVTRKWARQIAILDQGDLGSCEGNAEVGCAGTSPVFEALPGGHPDLDEAEAVTLYSEATRLDPYPGAWPPDDTGTDSTSVSKAAKNAGLIAGYRSAYDLAGVIAALQAGPVNLAFGWYDSFDNPPSSGVVTISAAAQVRGGHALCCRGVDVGKQQVFLDNSWGPGWGVNGSFYLGYATLDRLMAEGGECVAPVPLSAPPPVPADPDQALWNTLGPWCAQYRSRPDLVEVKQAGLAWAAAKGFA